MAANEKLLNILLKMRATLYQAPLGTRYFTSDQPVALYHPTLSTSAYGVGPSTNGVEISFPLNSKTLLMLDHVSGQHGERIATPAEVLEFNRRTVVMAQNYIFVGEGHELAESQVLEHSEQFAGFRHDNIDAGSEFVQIHRFIAVGPQ